MFIRLAMLLAAGLTLSAQSHKELEKLYVADQADRSAGFAISPEQFAKMVQNDGPRRKRVRELIDAGALTTSEDYVRAAFIFQHGATPDDFLMAHVLGMIATKMDGSGAWIAAASMDRYLLNTGKQQIFGLQLDSVAPFHAGLLTDRMRAAFCAPSVPSRTRFLAALAKEPDKAEIDDPCLTETAKALVGKWPLMRKGANGDWTQLTMEGKLDAEGNAVVRLSGAGIPREARQATEVGGNQVKIKVNGEVFQLRADGDVITGRWSSESGAGGLVGMR